MTKATTTKAPAGVAVNGEAVRERRKRLGHTITALAPQAQISIGYLSQIERGDRATVSPPTFQRLAAALGLADTPEVLEARQQPRRRRAA
jgi:transcriptional regulator with XRE-family HTH domain